MCLWAVMIPPRDAQLLADEITARLGYLDVIVAASAPPLPWSCGAILQAQDAGEDPTREWRRHVGLAQSRYYGVTAPPSVASAFVFQWYLGVVALPLAYASTCGRWVIDGAADALRFDLSEDQWFPCAVSILPERIDVAGDSSHAREQARRGYLAHARRFAQTYRTEVKMSSRQREGMVIDAWRMAVESASESVPSRRQSCCFIFALPGARPCAACPRLTVRGA